jgi:acetate kinase
MNENGEVIHEKEYSLKYEYQYFFELLLSQLTSSQISIAAVGHRVVHGGKSYHDPVLMTPSIIENLKQFIPFAPLHQPYNLDAIEIIGKAFPHLPQIACFDTAFHHSHPPIADYFGLPRSYLEAGVQRYGFHGLSYEYIMMKMYEIAPQKANGRIVIAHLGNGASMSAVHHGKCLDSTMGFTALDGLMMGTRCGSLDPGVILYLMQFKHLNHHEIEELLYKKSGLLGFSGISSNVKTLLESESENAKEAIDLFVYRIRRELGALVSVLGGLETFIFTGGIGENAIKIRSAVCQDMDWLGINIDKHNNENNQLIISSDKSHVDVRVIPTDEESIVAKHTYALLNKRP